MTIKKYFLVILSLVCTGSAFSGAHAFELQRPCPSADVHQTAAQWSPDGSRYAFSAENSRQSSIRICDIKSRKEIEIFSSSGSPAEALLHDRNMQKSVNIVGFSWAPDSRHYAFVRSEKNDIAKNGIYIGSIDQKTSAEDDPLIYDKSVASIVWVPWGERESGIIYMTGSDIKLVSLDQAYAVKKSGLIYSSENRKGSPVLSHDGRYLIWPEDTLNGPKLFRCDMDGAGKCRNRARLTSEKTEYKELCPSVSPDNSYVAFYSNRGTTQDQELGRIYTLWIVPAGGGTAKKASDHLVRGSASPALCPSWAGNKIIYVAAETDEPWPVHEAVITVKNNQLYAENRSLLKPVEAQAAAGSTQERIAVADLSVSPSSNTLVLSHQDFKNADGRFQMAWVDLNQAPADEKKYIESQASARKETERLEAQRKEVERLEARRKEEAVKVEAAIKEAERLESERKGAEKAEAARKQTERQEIQRKEAERAASARKEAERLEAERKQAERLEAQRKEAARAEAARKQTEQQEMQRKETERLAAARKEADRLEAERKEAEKVAAAQKAAERREVPKEETPGIVPQGMPAGFKDNEYAHIHYAGVISKTSNFSNFTEDEKAAFEQGKASRKLSLGSKQDLNEIDALLNKIAEFHYYRHHIGEGVDIFIVRTDSPDFYLEEFRDASIIEDLYEAFKNSRVSSSRPENSSPKSTVEWFNNLLGIPDLFEKMAEKKKSAFTNQAINALAEKTNTARKKGFAGLSSTDQMLIKKLNRLIFEEMYAKETPKMHERGYINVVRDEKDPSIYYIRLYDRQRTGMDQEVISNVGGGAGIATRLLTGIKEKIRSAGPDSAVHILARKDWEYFFNYKQNWFHSESSNETSMAGVVMISGMKDVVSIKAMPVRNSFRRKEELPFVNEEVRGYVMDTPYEWRVQIKP